MTENKINNYDLEKITGGRFFERKEEGLIIYDYKNRDRPYSAGDIADILRYEFNIEDPNDNIFNALNILSINEGGINRGLKFKKEELIKIAKGEQTTFGDGF